MLTDNDLIAAIYSTVGEEARWTEVLDRIKSRLGVESAVFQYLVAEGDDLVPVISCRDSWSMAVSERHDSWANSAKNPRFRRDTEPRSEDEIDSDHRNLFFTATDRTILHSGLTGCGLGVGFWLGCRTTPTEHTSMIFHRRQGDGHDITEGEGEFLKKLQPHFRELSRLIARTAQHDARLSLADALMESTSLALISCDSDMRVHWMNRAAEQLVNRLPQLRYWGGRMGGRFAEETALLRRTVSGQQGDSCHILGDEPADVLYFRVLKRYVADPWHVGCKLSLIALCSPRNSLDLDPAVVAKLFGLTMAEANLTTHLVSGMTVKEFAAHRGIAEGTARMQLKSALAKAGVGRQVDLVRQVCMSIAQV